jgi:hypothetical protein
MRPATLLTLTATLTAILSAATPPTIRTTEPVEITKLNECIQIRFLDRRSFGMARVAPLRRHGDLRTFVPENPAERALVEQIKEKGLEVAVFLVGRQALPASASGVGRAGLQGPASVTWNPEVALPDGAALLAEGKTALKTIGEGKGYDVRKGEWTVAMRPLRASNEGCLGCHIYGPAVAAITMPGFTAAPKLGDTLGVVMYVYRRHE